MHRIHAELLNWINSDEFYKFNIGESQKRLTEDTLNVITYREDKENRKNKYLNQ